MALISYSVWADHWVEDKIDLKNRKNFGALRDRCREAKNKLLQNKLKKAIFCVKERKPCITIRKKKKEGASTKNLFFRRLMHLSQSYRKKFFFSENVLIRVS